MKIFALIEMADVELIGLRLYRDAAEARTAFDRVVEENQATPWEYTADEMAREVPGTIAFAGDDTYSVQLIEREVQP